MKIGIVAPASRLDPSLVDRLTALVARLYPTQPPELIFSPQCFLSAGHFAGDDETRAQALLNMANDPRLDALWFARGGYGSGRLLERVLPALTPTASQKTYLGYSDLGMLLAGMYGLGFRRLAHGPMPSDLQRPDGERAVARALAFLVSGAAESLEPSVASAGQPLVAFNLTILCHLLGTPWLPDLTGHILMLEEVSEQIYRIDRCLFQLTSHPMIRKVAGIKLGRCSQIPPNDPDFGQDEEAVTRFWCARSGIAYLGRADIGHDIENKVVPFGV
ncbi:MAG TPA: LD-carboxypeptidase [Rhodospirillaceae bacterium]|nr:LD-carboxypeptidase [Rhodospirillaceae bacterium]